MSRHADVVIAGHICLDIIPAIHGTAGVDALLIPGKLVDIGSAVIATGGAVSNTGIALHRLGNRVQLVGKIGDDPFGDMILRVLAQHGDTLGDGMIVAPGEPSSYTIVISPPGTDRVFLHCTGANDTYAASDLREEQWAGARLFHFGYPPLMRKMYENQGEQLALLLSRVKRAGLTVSLDLARPDPDSAAGKANWRAILQRSLPFVDVFLPSLEEILYMLRRDQYEQMTRRAEKGDMLSLVDGALLFDLSEDLLEMGVAVVGLKLGEHGLYVRTTADPLRLASIGLCAPERDRADHWLNREWLSPCYEVAVEGTTGAGDCTIAGFLSGMLQGSTLEEAVQLAVGVGAFNVERMDATGGVPALDAVRQRMRNGWNKRAQKLDLPGWVENEKGLWSRQTNML